MTELTSIPGAPIAVCAHPTSLDMSGFAAERVVGVVMNCDHGQHYRSPVPVLHFPFSDSALVPGRERVEAAVDAVARCRPRNGIILFHCAAGLNRSAFCAVVYLVRHCEMPVADAIALVQRYRQGSLFNVYFVAALMSWYRVEP